MLNRLRSFSRSRFSNISRLQRSSKVLLGCSTALATVALVAFSLSLPQAISTINVLHSLQQVVGISDDGQGGIAGDSTSSEEALIKAALSADDGSENGGSVDGATEIPRVDASLLNNVVLGGSSGGSPVANGGAANSNGDNGQATNGQDQKSASSSKQNSKKSTGKSTSKSSGATSGNSSNGQSGVSAPSGNSSDSSSKYKPAGETVWLTESEMQEYVSTQHSLANACNDVSNEIGTLQTVCNQSPMKECQSWKSGSSIGDYTSLAKSGISSANKAIAKANSYLSRSKPSSKFSVLTDADDKLRTAWKNVISGANLIKSFYNKYLQCPNPKTHFSCFANVAKPHLTSYQGAETVDYLADAAKARNSIKNF